MSSYLNIYLKVKSKEMKEPAFILLDYYSRSSDIYQAFNDEGNFYSSDGQKFEVSEGSFQRMLEDLQGQINNCMLYITTAKEMKTADIQEVVDKKEYMAELKQTRNYIDFLYNLIKNKEFTSVEGIYCNID